MKDTNTVEQNIIWTLFCSFENDCYEYGQDDEIPIMRELINKYFGGVYLGDALSKEELEELL